MLVGWQMNNEKEELAYDVMANDKVIGYIWGPTWGGLVYHPDNTNIVGAIRHDLDLDLYWLDASQPHHTGKLLNGEKVFVSNRPNGTH
jgi:hypothetical protein